MTDTTQSPQGAAAPGPPSGLTPPRPYVLANDGQPIVMRFPGAATAEYSAEAISRLASIRERLAKRTPGTWTAERRQEDGWNQDDWLVVFPDGEDATVLNEANADFIAHAPNDMAWLLARLDAQRESSAIAAAEEPERAAPPREASGGATWARTADALREFAGGEFPFTFRGGKSMWCGTHRVYHPESLCELLTRYDAERAPVAPTSPVAGAPEPHEN